VTRTHAILIDDPFDGTSTRAVLHAAGFTRASVAGLVSVTIRPPSWQSQAPFDGTVATSVSFTKSLKLCPPGARQSA
jgi:hypothetical protein